jgi:hypothetical protein
MKSTKLTWKDTYVARVSSHTQRRSHARAPAARRAFIASYQERIAREVDAHHSAVLELVGEHHHFPRLLAVAECKTTVMERKR